MTICVILESSYLGKGVSKNFLLAVGGQAISYLILLFILGSNYEIVGFALAFFCSLIVRLFINLFNYNREKQNQSPIGEKSTSL